MPVGKNCDTLTDASSRNGKALFHLLGDPGRRHERQSSSGVRARGGCSKGSSDLLPTDWYFEFIHYLTATVWSFRWRLEAELPLGVQEADDTGFTQLSERVHTAANVEGRGRLLVVSVWWTYSWPRCVSQIQAFVLLGSRVWHGRTLVDAGEVLGMSRKASRRQSTNKHHLRHGVGNWWIASARWPVRSS